MKRAFDLLVILGSSPIWIPLLLLTALLMRWRLGCPILFKQERVGLGGKIFCLYKFRSMKDLRDPAGRLLPDAQRLTPFGRWLRRSSLDELPELWNVLRGEMSLVGPRPLLPQYLERYTPEQARRHQVKPGLTGWAQVQGRNAVDWEERFRLDCWYVDNQSLLLDLKILLRTLTLALRGEGVSAPGEATMSEFKGSQQAHAPMDAAAGKTSDTRTG